MKTVVLIIAILAMCSLVGADEYTVSSDLIGFENDSMLAPGSTLNPLIIRDSSGREVGSMETEMIGFDSDDGMFAPGGALNPYILTTD